MLTSQTCTLSEESSDQHKNTYSTAGGLFFMSFFKISIWETFLYFMLIFSHLQTRSFEGPVL